MKIVFDPAELRPSESCINSDARFRVRDPYYAGETKSLLFCGVFDLLLDVETNCEDQIQHIADTLNGFLERGGDTVRALEIEILPDLVRLTGRSAEEILGHTFFAADKVTE